MTALQEELQETLNRETAALPVGIRSLAQVSMREQWDREDLAAAAARAEVGRLNDGEVQRTQAELEVALSTVAALECDLLVARRKAAELGNRRVQAIQALRQRERQANSSATPAYQIAAARRVLERLESRLEKWQVEPPPLVRRPFKLKSVPDPRFPNEEEQHLSVSEALGVVVTAAQMLYAIERGSEIGPDDLDKWLEEVISEVEMRLVFQMKPEQHDPEDLARITEMLRLMATGAHPVYGL